MADVVPYWKRMILTASTLGLMACGEGGVVDQRSSTEGSEELAGQGATAGDDESVAKTIDDCPKLHAGHQSGYPGGKGPGQGSPPGKGEDVIARPPANPGVEPNPPPPGKTPCTPVQTPPPPCEGKGACGPGQTPGQTPVDPPPPCDAGKGPCQSPGHDPGPKPCKFHCGGHGGKDHGKKGKSPWWSKWGHGRHGP